MALKLLSDYSQRLNNLNNTNARSPPKSAVFILLRIVRTLRTLTGAKHEVQLKFLLDMKMVKV